MSCVKRYKNWKVHLKEALIRPGSGLIDLGDKLSGKSKSSKLLENSQRSVELSNNNHKRRDNKYALNVNTFKGFICN